MRNSHTTVSFFILVASTGLRTNESKHSLLVSAESSFACIDNDVFRLNGNEEKSCEWIGAYEERRKGQCTKNGKGFVRYHCPLTCGECCEDDPTFRFPHKDMNLKCSGISLKSKGNEWKREKLCRIRNNEGLLVSDYCPKTCNKCFVSLSDDDKMDDSPTTAPKSMTSMGPKRPNLIIVLTDQQSIRTIGSYRDLMSEDNANIWGDGVKVDTPHLDRFAKQGALFSQYYVNEPSCTPSRGAFLSGQYPAVNGADGNHVRWNDDTVTFAKLLRKYEGYKTGYLGKWHLDGDAKPGFNVSQPFGFKHDRYRYNRGHWKFIEEEDDGSVGVYTMEDMDRFDGRVEQNYATDFLFDSTIDFIRTSVEEDRHFAVITSIPDPHNPYEVRPPYDSMYSHFDFELPKTAIAAFRRDPSRPSFADHWEKKIPETRPDIEAAEEFIKNFHKYKKYQQKLRHYFGMIKLIDDNFGKLLSTLTDLNIDDNTIVMFTSDHGDMMLEHGRFYKGVPYAASAQAPLLIRYPGHIKPGKVIESAFSSIDVFPTLMNLIGELDDKTKEVLSTLPGIDASEDLLSNEMVVSSNNVMYFGNSRSGKAWAGAFNGRHKLVLSQFDMPWLFVLDKDPDELVNFFNDFKYSRVVIELRNSLIETMQKHKFGLLAKADVIYLDEPTCLDSRDRLEEDTFRTCNDITPSDCEIGSIRKQCPNTCKSCACKDSSGFFLVNGSDKMFSCADVVKEDLCLKYPKRIADSFCPKSCGVCS